MKKKKRGSIFESWIDGTFEKQSTRGLKKKSHYFASKISKKVTDLKDSAEDKVRSSTSLFGKFIPSRKRKTREYNMEFEEEYEDESYEEEEYKVEKHKKKQIKKSGRTRKTPVKLPTVEFANIITKNPWLTILVMAAITLLFVSQIPNLNIHGEMDVMLPEGEETSEIVQEVRQYWSTDIIMIYTEIEDPYNDTTNVSSKECLREMSYVEETIDPDKDDRGENDDVIWCLSISTVVKEVNNTQPRLLNATIKNLGEFIKSYGVTLDDEEIRKGIIIPADMGEYSIPDNQDRIDSTLNGMPENLKNKIVIDINNDEIWDSCVIIIGITEDVDPSEMVDRMQEVIDNRETNITIMTQTGPVPLTVMGTESAFDYYYKCFILGSFLVVIAIFMFHRSLKAVLIAGTPTVCSIGWIYGFLGITGFIVTPTIIVLGPLLLALGVSYGIHMANRIAEEPDDDPRVRAKVAIRTTGLAVLLSAVTTMIGFSSLMFTNLLPVRTVGFSLTLGIFFCFLLTMIMAPPLAVITNYRKRGKVGHWKRTAKIPINHSKLIIIIVIIALIISVGICLPLIERDTDLMAYAPDRDTDWFGQPIENFDSVEAAIKYTENFKGGALGMILVKGMLRSDDYDNDNEDPVNNLDEIEKIENDINEISKKHPDLSVNAISIVTILKAIGGEGNISLRLLVGDFGPIDELIPEELLDNLLVPIQIEGNFWDMLHRPGVYQNKPLRKFLLNVFYDTLSDESRGMVINEYRENETTGERYPEYYEKTLIYVDMPIMSDKEGHRVVDKVDDICLDKPHGDLIVTRLTGVAAIAIAVNDSMFTSQIISLVLAIIFVFITLLLIFKYTKPYKNALKLSLLATITILSIVGLEPLIMKIFDTELNLATLMIGSSIIGAGVDFSIHITQRIRERGETIESIEKAVETSGMGLFEATMITIFGLSAAFYVPAPIVFKFIFVVMVLLALSAAAAMFILPAIYVELIRRKERIRLRREG